MTLYDLLHKASFEQALAELKSNHTQYDWKSECFCECYEAICYRLDKFEANYGHHESLSTEQKYIYNAKDSAQLFYLVTHYLLDHNAKIKPMDFYKIALDGVFSPEEVRELILKYNKAAPKKWQEFLRFHQVYSRNSLFTDSKEAQAERVIGLLKLHELYGFEFSPSNLAFLLTGFFYESQTCIGVIDDCWQQECRNIVIPIAQFLLDSGADINGTGHSGHTPLMSSAMWLLPELTEFYISQGADVNQQSDKGYTALMFASGQIYRDCYPSGGPFKEQTDIVEALLRAGADKNIKANNRRSAVSIAKKAENQALLDMFER